MLACVRMVCTGARPPPRPILAETSIHRGGWDGQGPALGGLRLHSSVAPSLTVVSSNVSTNSNLLNGAAAASGAPGVAWRGQVYITAFFKLTAPLLCEDQEE